MDFDNCNFSWMMISVVSLIIFMFFNQYKEGRNHGLLPRIQTKSASPLLTSYAVLEDSFAKGYELHRHAEDKNKFFMYNDKEYMQRHCSMIASYSDHFDAIKSIGKLYPTHDQTFALYVANSPKHADRDILGSEQYDSIISLAYKDLKQKKSARTALTLSIVGIENQNSLSDELNFDWIQNGIDEIDKQDPIRATLKLKQKLKLIKSVEANECIAHNLSIYSINSLSALKDIIKRYKQIKNYFEEWTDVNKQTEYLPQGQLYHLCEAQYDQTDGALAKIIRSHYVLRVNQYLRSANPFLLRLGINFRKLSESNYGSMQIHESKIFRLLSHCFTMKNDKNQMAFRFHIFFQVGFYLTLKQQYLNLSTFSRSLSIENHLNEKDINRVPFLYLKQFRKFHTLCQMINQIELTKSPQQKIISYLDSDCENKQQKLRKVKSYAFDTQNSLDKKISKFRRLTEQTPPLTKEIDLQQLVHETSKINTEINIKEITVGELKYNSAQKRIKNRQKSVRKLHKAQLFSEQQRHNIQLNKLNQAGKFFRHNTEGSRTNNMSKFYEKTKKWLCNVYGQNQSKRIKHIKSEMQRQVRRLDKIQNYASQNKFKDNLNEGYLDNNQ